MCVRALQTANFLKKLLPQVVSIVVLNWHEIQTIKKKRLYVPPILPLCIFDQMYLTYRSQVLGTLTQFISNR